MLHFKWPFARRSTVERLEAEVQQLRSMSADSWNATLKWEARASEAYKRIEELVDPEKALKPERMARIFCEMGSDEQAAFFNTVGEATSKWEINRVFQWAHVHSQLDDEGLHLLDSLGEYGMASRREFPRTEEARRG